MAGRDVRNSILPMACQILMNQGLEALHARSIATSLGVNHATIHYYFKTRQDLMTGIIHHLVSEHGLNYDRKVVTVKDSAALREHLALFKNYFGPGEHFFSVWGALVCYSEQDPTVSDILAKALGQFIEEVRQSIDRTRKADVKVRKGPLRNPEILVPAILGLGMAQAVLSIDQLPKFKAIEVELLD
ncbi:MAG: TetR/AcrR family transcriptional regulator [Armatimonadetes bacterium]|nr:TetR/AcrR family transcriptional regulator [Armatimonadota bacterium]